MPKGSKRISRISRNSYRFDSRPFVNRVGLGDGNASRLSDPSSLQKTLEMGAVVINITVRTRFNLKQGQEPPVDENNEQRFFSASNFQPFLIP